MDNTIKELVSDNSSYDKLSISKELSFFIHNIDSLYTTLPWAYKAVTDARKYVLEDIKTKYNPTFEKLQAKEDIPSDYLLEQTRQIKRDASKLFKHTLASQLVLRSFTILLVSQYDAFLGKLIRILLLMQPGILNTSDKTITFSQLQSFSSIENAIEHIIEREVDSVLRQSHYEQIEWLENKFNLKLRSSLNNWSNFVEITERRNLFVHTNGIVSNQYLTNCKKHDVKLPQDITLGSKIDITIDYFNKAYKNIFEIGTEITHLLWRKLFPKDLKNADDNLSSLCYDLLFEEKFELACTLLDFATNTLKKYSSERERRVMVINRAQAYKWSGNTEKAREIIASEDWSATDALFQLAVAVLLDNFDRANILMRNLGNNSKLIGKISYREWPLFREYRKTEQFCLIFQEVFEEPLNIIEEDNLFVFDGDYPLINTEINKEVETIEGTENLDTN